MLLEKDSELIELLTKIHDMKGLDFTQYKPATLIRRISSRMRRYNLSTYNEYLKVLNSKPEEYNELVSALTINVTEFFRNPESFKAIQDVVIPRVLVSKWERSPKIIKAWSCACSTGDEPYSLAMVFLEKVGAAIEKFNLSIIGSDVDREAISKARDMIYSRDRIEAVDSELLRKYFDKVDEDCFKVKENVKELVQFRCHDVIKDRPFMHCDIILCRNLLIYFNKQLQEETLLKFYECLNPGGYLVLGMTESLTGTAVNHFEHINNILRIYRKPDNLQTDKLGTILSQEEIDNLVKDMLNSKQEILR